MTSTLIIQRNLIKRINLLIAISSENLLSTMSPILGQYGINVADFIERVRASTKFLTSDVRVKTTLQIYTTGVYDLSIEPLCLIEIVRCCDLPLRNIELYAIIVLKGFLTGSLADVFLKKLYFNLCGYVKSFE